jgi:hypothetical protein
MIASMTDLGPVQLITVVFDPDAKYEGRIVGVLERLEVGGALRVLSAAFVRKHPDTGELQAIDTAGGRAQGVIGTLLGFRLDMATGRPAPELPAGGSAGGLSRADVEEIGASLEPGAAAGLVLVEHAWMRDLERALADTGGTTTSAGFLDQATVTELAL